MGSFRMPSLGADMEKGTIIEWRVGPGDTVRRGDIVAVVDTEKSDIEIEVFESGTVGEIVVPAGAEVPVGTVIATIVTEGAAEPVAPVTAVPERLSVPAVVPEAPPVVPPARPARPSPHAAPPRRVARAGRSSPYARRRAAELGVDIAEVATQVADRPVRAADVDAFAAQAAAPAARATPPTTAAAPRAEAAARGGPRAQPEGIGAVGRLMERSKREIPHYYVAEDIDVGHALAWMEARNAERSVEQRLLPAALLLRAVVLALRDVPQLNAHHVDGTVHTSDAVHLGVAVAQRGGGLVAPVILDAHTMGVDELMAGLLGVVRRARAGTLRGSDVAAATITVTNLGEQGATGVWGVIVPPQVAIVGFGRIANRPWAVGDLLAVRPVVSATLSADHRVTHGHQGARFLRAVARALESPESLE